MVGKLTSSEAVAVTFCVEDKVTLGSSQPGAQTSDSLHQIEGDASSRRYTYRGLFFKNIVLTHVQLTPNSLC